MPGHRRICYRSACGEGSRKDGRPMDAMNVLIADDSALVRERLRVMLAEVPGVQLIRETANVEETMAALQAVKPDVTILDIKMPDGSGIEVLRHAKQTGTSPVVIMLTSFATPEYRAVCLAAGADFFLDKSSEFLTIADVLKKLMPDPPQT